MLSTKHAKHAKPAFHPTRSHLSAGLTAALLPLCLASPALADSTPITSASSSTAPVMGMTGTTLAEPAAETSSTDAAPTDAAATQPDAGQPDAGQPDASQPTSAPSPEASPSGEAAPSAEASPSAESAPEPTATQAPEQAKMTTELRISGPGGAVAPGNHQIAVRLLADDKPVKNGYVRVEKWTSTGWAYAGRLLTRGDGLGWGQFSFASSTKVRALYEGSTVRTAETSREIPVQVRKAENRQADFRQRALKVAAQLNGRPYRYGSTGPSSFDCSGFTGFVYRQVGKSLPRTSRQQRTATQPVSLKQAVPGDLIFMTRNGRDIGHVGIYAGNGKMWDAPSSGGRVSLRRIYSSDFRVGRIS